MLDGPLLLAQVVEGIARRGDVTIPEFHVFATPRSSEVFRLIFPEGQAAWPGIVLVVTVVAVIAEALRLAAGGVTRAWREADYPELEQQQRESSRELPATDQRPSLSSQRQPDYNSDDGWGGWGGTVGRPGALTDIRQHDVLLSSSDAAVDDAASQPAEGEVTRWGAHPQQSPATAVQEAQQAAWERLVLSRDVHDDRNRGLLFLAAVTLVALWATGALNLPAHDPLDAGA